MKYTHATAAEVTLALRSLLLGLGFGYGGEVGGI